MSTYMYLVAKVFSNLLNALQANRLHNHVFCGREPSHGDEMNMQLLQGMKESALRYLTSVVYRERLRRV